MSSRQEPGLENGASSVRPSGDRGEAEVTLLLCAKRLRLRPATVGDIPFLHRLWTDRDVRRYLWDDEVIAVEQAAEVVQASRDSFTRHGFGMWVVELAESGEPIGFAGLRTFGEAEEVEILYGLLPQHWHQGLATEAARAVLDHAFEHCHLPIVFAGCDPPNTASIEVMKRLGMTHHGNRRVHGQETIYYAVAAQGGGG